MSNAVVKLFLSCQLPNAKYKCDCVDVRIAEVVVHWTLSERLLILCPASCTNRQLYHPNIAECPLMCATCRERTTLDMFFKTDNLEAFCNITGNGKHQPAHTRHIKSVQIFPALKIFSDLRILNAAIHTNRVISPYQFVAFIYFLSSFSIGPLHLAKSELVAQNAHR